MSSVKKMAILTATPEVIRELLQLPDNAVIRNIRSRYDYYGNLEIVVEGVGWDIMEGQPVMKAPVGEITYSAISQDMIVDWKLPK